MNVDLLFFEGILKETPWGGSRLKDYAGNLPSSNVGELWLASAHPNGCSTVLSGAFKGKSLSFLWENNPELFGFSKSTQFPILTKIIDANTDLSVQVHPTDEYAALHENGSLGKSECWYVLDAKENAKIIIGHNAKSKDEVLNMIQKGCWKNFLNEVPVKSGDFFYIPSGTVHAIKGGTLIFEVQQSSDITYRLYDYDRLVNGKKRELHIEKSLDVIKYPYVKEPTPLNKNKTINKNFIQLVSSRFFSVWILDVKLASTFVQDQAFMIATVIDGHGTVSGHTVKKGSCFIIPFEYGKVFVEGNLRLIISSP